MSGTIWLSQRKGLHIFWQGRKERRKKGAWCRLHSKEYIDIYVGTTIKWVKEINNSPALHIWRAVNLAGVYGPILYSPQEDEDKNCNVLDALIKPQTMNSCSYLVTFMQERVQIITPGTLFLTQTVHRIYILWVKTPTKFSWKHSRSKHWYKLDLTITGRDNFENVLHSHS